MKPGRNDPCPCGSGKKYKHCCLAAEVQSAASVREITWRRIRRALDEFKMGDTLLRFTAEAYGPMAIEEAWAEFTVWSEEEELAEFEPDSPYIPLFMSWFFHAWAPEAAETGVEDAALQGRIPTEVYLERHRRRVDPLVCRYLEACVEGLFSFHEIIECEPGRGFKARDLFTGEEFEVTERSASETLRAHDIIFGEIVRIDGIAMLEGCSVFNLEPESKLPVLDLRDEILSAEGAKGKEAVREYNIELRELYLALTQKHLNPQMPELQNTDGEPLVLHRVIYEIDSPQGAFDALKHLAGDESEASLLSAAERDERGELLRVDIPWIKAGNARHRGLKNTLLGQIRIEPKRLTCEVNSVKRAESFRGIMEESLGTHARFKATEVQSIERMMAERTSRTRKSSPADAENAHLMARPEVQAHLNAMLAAHYEEWLTEKIPALGRKTPLEVARSAEGRERVEALLLGMERKNAGLPFPPDPAILRRVRERLGLLESR
jgi:SEC-C motif/Protein of unknown function (DUF2384)